MTQGLRIRPLFPPERGDSMHFASLGSGSSGNCYYLRYRDTAILIDAGVAPRTILQRLKTLSVQPEEISGIFITHDHADHVRSVGLLATRHDIPVYASPKVAAILAGSRYISEDLTPYIREMEVGRAVEVVAGMEILSFEVPHDACHTVGYSVTTSAGVFSLITDIGHVSPEIRTAVERSNFLVFESNYDPEMLTGGSYPDFLKERITSGSGHISNVEAANFIAESYHLDLKFLALCHLSKHNNHPDLAFKTMEHRLFNEGIRVGKDLDLHVLGRSSVSPLYELNINL